MKGFGCHMMSVENIIELKGIKKRFEDNFEAVKDEVGFCLTREESESETTHNTAEAA